jgi:hypothetical protein
LGHDAHSILVKDNAAVFNNLMANDYHLAANSVAINKGTSEVASIVNQDLEKNARPIGGQYDIGCYEKLGVTGLNREFQNKTFQMVSYGIQFTFTGLNEDMSVEIFNLEGQSVAMGQQFEFKIFNSGIYVYHVLDFKEHRRVGMGKIFIIGSK